MKRKDLILISILFLFPYAFVGLYIDAHYGSLIGYMLGLVVICLTVHFIRRYSILFPIILSSIGSTIISIERVGKFLGPEWNYFFKPFSAMQLVLIIGSIVIITQVTTYFFTGGKFDISNYWKDTLEQNKDAMKKYFDSEAKIYWYNTNEEFTVDEYIRANCEYPGDWEGKIEKVEKKHNLIITAVKVVLKNSDESYHVVSFITLKNNKIICLEEYWGDDSNIPEWRKEMKIGRKIMQ
ncbi:hypothetical protein SAMN00017477_0822 [Peptoniphilus asaccharolyticus DSM 20463]|uniref:SnoaL-like domain-containing protein n=1 Tax=Peptoniphilus asaccharolyticus DSM 20463 TaxID=573058 RepID=A0A1W1UXU0_PEPAS|nr:hypothetical protein [Peptoniphilus asaccharolyticus]SMB85879.1 hypothetical protein SAMN00017477_0822 [Peptoniphilus asaccharolyticus DSM 20463]